MALLTRTLRNVSGPRPRGTVTPSSGPTLLAESDVTYLGAFKLAHADIGPRPIGLTVRWVGGQRRVGVLRRSTSKFNEFTVPTLVSTSSNWDAGTGLNYATHVKEWATSPLGADARTGTNSVLTGSPVWGISWDEADKRVYWQVSSTYDSTLDPDTPSFGWGVVDDGGDTLTAGNRVVFTSPSVPWKQLQGGVVNIPSWFASAYLSGKRLGIGFGGYRSLANNGSAASIGPALYAIDPPAASPAEGDARTGGPRLLGSTTSETRQPRPAWAGSASNHFEVGSDPAKWDWNTIFQNSLAWIDTGTKHGVVLLAGFVGGRMDAIVASSTLSSVTVTDAADIVDVQPGDYVKIEVGAGGNGNNRTPAVASVVGATITFTAPVDDTPLVGGVCQAGGYYANSLLYYSRWQAFGFLVYDPADLAAVAGGTKQPYEVVPAASWSLYPPMFSLPAPTNTYALTSEVGGGPPVPQVAFDPVENRLYCLWNSGYRDGTSEYPGILFVYQVAS